MSLGGTPAFERMQLSNGITDKQILFLAKELHSTYRAAFKALHKDANRFACHECSGCVNEHDHGWAGCHRQNYFIQRAKHVIKARNVKIEVPF